MLKQISAACTRKIIKAVPTILICALFHGGTIPKIWFVIQWDARMRWDTLSY